MIKEEFRVHTASSRNHICQDFTICKFQFRSRREIQIFENIKYQECEE